MSLGAAALSPASDEVADTNNKTAISHRTSDHTIGANDKVILALIGAGNFGHRLITSMTKNNNAETKYLCDVDNNRGAGTISELEKIQGRAPKRVVDMREVFDDKDVNGIVIATPEHWHALATVWACQTGKDVYVEKNISMTIWESRKMLEAARKYKCIVQCGTQNRSAPYGYSARDYIKSGKLGKVLLVKVYNMSRESGEFIPKPDSPVPAGLDWDRWLGPAPEKPYNVERHKGWVNFWDYAPGDLGHSASHQLDFARLAMGDPLHPKSVYCLGGRLAYNDYRETPDLQLVTYDYGDFAMTVDLTDFTPYIYKELDDVRFTDKFPDWPRNATRVEIYGTERMMYLGRMGGGWQVLERKGRGKTAVVEIVDQQPGRYPKELHEANFIDCIRSRKMPNGDIEQGHYSATLVHLGNTSNRLGNKHLAFDGKTETFTNSSDANALLKPAYRKNYRIPEQV
jgi:predicted dehydrogenase